MVRFFHFRLAARVAIFLVAGVALAALAWQAAHPPTAQAQASRGVRVKSRKAQQENLGKRIALVIGNARYRTAPLRNPVNDSRDMATTLRGLGFQVSALENASRRKMALAIRKFGNDLKHGGVGLFYYSGHGMEVKGRNYLIPVGAQVETEDEVEFEAVDAGRVLRAMERADNGMNIVILDACRNNPFARSFRAANQGLARMDAPRGTFISYATSPGKVASDGSGSNGLYTGMLVKHMKTPGLPIEEMFKQVRADVFTESSQTQVPWSSSSLLGGFYFAGKTVARKPPPAAAVASRSAAVAQAPRTIDAEEEFWRTIKNSIYPQDFRAYIQTYPKGRFVPIARVKLRQLGRAGPPAKPSVSPPVTASVAPPSVGISAPPGKWVAPGKKGAPAISLGGAPGAGSGSFLRVLSGHKHRVQGVALSPDGSRAVTASLDRSARIWDTSTGRTVAGLNPGRDRLFAAAFSPDGSQVMTAGTNEVIVVWDAASGRKVKKLKGHRDTIYSVAYSPDGRLAVSGDEDNIVIIWDIAAGKLLRKLKGHSGTVRSVAYSPDGLMVASGSDDKTAILWEVLTGNVLRRLKGHSSRVYGVDFSPDGALLASGSGDKTIALWEVATGRQVRVLNGHSSIVYAVAFSPHGRLLISGSKDRTVKLWDINTGQVVQSFTGHKKHIYTVSFSRDGRLAASGSADTTARLWTVPGQ